MNLTDWLKLNPEARRRAAWPFSSLNPMTSANEILRKQGLSPVRNRSLRDAIATRLTFIQFVSEDRAKSKEDDLRQDTIRQWDRVRSALGLDILHDEKDILEAIKELKDKADNSIQLNRALGRVSTEDRLMVLHAATESLVEWFRKGARTIEPLLRWKQAVRDFMP